MSKNSEFETYLIITPNAYEIYLFDTKNFKNLYEQNLTFQNNTDVIDQNLLNKFLEENIFKIEKLLGEFVRNIFLIIENNKILNIHLGIKKKMYEKNINKKYLENILVDANDLFKENYQNQKTMHIIISRYFANGEYYQNLEDNLKSEYLCLEIQFKIIPKNIGLDIEKILGKYQIFVSQYLDRNYIKSFIKDEQTIFSEMIYKIKNGLNENEAKLVPKNPKKTGFFEKFFQLFG